MSDLVKSAEEAREMVNNGLKGPGVAIITTMSNGHKLYMWKQEDGSVRFEVYQGLVKIAEAVEPKQECERSFGILLS